MLHRQRVLLELLRSAGRPLLRIELVKWAFVLRHETPSGGGSAFYEFLPFKQGPYSFNLKREMDQLVQMAAVSDADGRWKAEENVTIPEKVCRDLEGVSARLRSLDLEDLLKHVYGSHPEYTINSEIERLAERRVAEPAIYTAGYEGLQVDAFLHRLIRAGIRRLVDVRHNPIARRYGFHKSTLSNLSEQVGIEYVHIPELGIPSAERVGLDATLDRFDLLARYERERLPKQESAVASLVASMRDKPSALVCMEAAPCECHRSRLAERLATLTGMPVVHIDHDC